jgi:hypothetical protein
MRSVHSATRLSTETALEAASKGLSVPMDSEDRFVSLMESVWSDFKESN